MTAIQQTGTSQNNQPVTTAVQEVSNKTTPTTTAGSSDFEKMLRSLVSPDKANNVSEEDLFAALVQERIKATKGEEAATQFAQYLSDAKSAVARPDGFVSMEDATKLALQKFRTDQKVTAAEADKIYSESFAAAQLDSNTDALFDNRGGANDPTIAVDTLEKALLAARVKIEEIDAGTATVKDRSVDEASWSKGQSGLTPGATGSAGFLYKPISARDGKMAVLLPPALSGKGATVSIVGPDGQVLETGKTSGISEGTREKFSFSKPGSGYPNGSSIQAILATGEIVTYLIKNTSARTENIDGSSGPAPAASAPATAAAAASSKTPAKSASSSTGSTSDQGL